MERKLQNEKTKLTLSALVAVVPAVLSPLTHFASAETTNSQSTETGDKNIQAKILVDNSNEKIVETRDENNIYVATYNKNSEELKIDTYDLDKNLLNSDVLTGIGFILLQVTIFG